MGRVGRGGVGRRRWMGRKGREDNGEGNGGDGI